MATDSLGSLYRAADAPLRGVLDAPSTGRVAESTPSFRYPPKPQKRRKQTPEDREEGKRKGSHPPDEDHLVDDYA